MIEREGVIKFQYVCISRERDIYPGEFQLIELRNSLRELGLVGAVDGVGYGNVSMRTYGSRFLITASQTGHLEVIDSSHLVEIVRYDMENNVVWCRGKMPPSSESLTHAGAYEGDARVKCVAHVHSPLLWRRYYGKVVTTPQEAEYGTPELALAVMDAMDRIEKLPAMMVLGGHKDGLLFVGEDCHQVYDLIRRYLLI